MTPWTAAILAEWTLDLDTGDPPDAVIAKTEDCLIDAIACAVPDRCADGARRVHSVAESTFVKGDAVVWIETERLHPTRAAFANAASAWMLDIDDGQPIRLWCDRGRNRSLTHGPDEFGRAR